MDCSKKGARGELRYMGRYFCHPLIQENESKGRVERDSNHPSAENGNNSLQNRVDRSFDDLRKDAERNRVVEAGLDSEPDRLRENERGMNARSKFNDFFANMHRPSLIGARQTLSS